MHELSTPHKSNSPANQAQTTEMDTPVQKAHGRLMDTFARTTAKNAHARATEAERLFQLLIGSRPPGHAGRCCLCGEPASGRYCRQHEGL